MLLKHSFKMKKYLVIGSGLQGKAIAYYHLMSKDTGKVSVVDYDESKAKDLAAWLNNERVDWFKADASDVKYMVKVMKNYDAVNSAVDYEFNLGLTKAAIKARVNFCDLGGNDNVVHEQFMLHKDAKKSKVKVMPALGIAPGAVSVIAMLCRDKLNEIQGNIENRLGVKGYPDYVKIRVGGLPCSPKNFLKYSIVFSVHGLINEYIEPVEILRDGRKEIVEPLTAVEDVLFNDFNDAELAVLSAAYTSGGLGTLAKSLENKVGDVDYKTLRYNKEHWQFFNYLKDTGFFENSTREFTEKQLEKFLGKTDEDLLVAKVTADRKFKNDIVEVCYEMLVYYDDKLSAMQKSTGFPAAIIAQMMANNEIKGYGVLRLELSTPPKLFAKRLNDSGLKLKERRKARKRNI